jgi:hypothetical protein
MKRSFSSTYFTFDLEEFKGKITFEFLFLFLKKTGYYYFVDLHFVHFSIFCIIL